MHIAVKANQQQKAAFLLKPVSSNCIISWCSNEFIDADVYFDLLFEEESAAFANISAKPVFVNAVVETCKLLPANFIRLNAWNGFLERDIVEVAAHHNMQSAVSEILRKLGWNFIFVPDEPGMITARIVCMIINEAYFALEDNVSTKNEIDIAMKLGTNYPYGPFEWSEKIGLKKVVDLLKKLNENDSRYLVSAKLESEMKLQ